MELFRDIFRRACERKGGVAALEYLLDKPKSAKQLKALDDSRYLSELSKKVFQSGFVWRVVENKWPEFEEVFWHFSIEKLLLMPTDMLEQKSQDKRIIRNFKKVQSIILNAQMIHNAAEKHGSFANFVADWPTEDIIGLWEYLAKNGTRLGGNTGPYGLRTIGKDTFLLSQDVEQYFRQHKLIEGGLRSKRSLQTIQNVFNDWHQESGRTLQEISRIVSFSCGDNFVGIIANNS